MFKDESLEASVDRGVRSVRTGSGVGPKTTRRRTGDSSQVSTPHLGAVAPWSRQGGTPSGLRNSGWPGCRHASEGDSILVGDYDDSLGWSIE